MTNLGGWEIVILLGLLVLFFGAKRLPDMARSIGQSARVFKGEMKGMKNDGDKTDAPADVRAADPAPAPPAALPPPAAPPPAAPVAAAPVAATPGAAAPESPAQAAQPGSSSTAQ